MEEELFNWFKLLVISFTVLLFVLKVAILLWWIRKIIFESPAVAPPEVHIGSAAQQQHEAELVAAASQPLPDDDDDPFE